MYDKVLQVNTLSYGLLRCIYYCMEKMQNYKHSHSERSSHNQPTRSEPLSSSLGDKTTQLRCDQAMKYEVRKIEFLCNVEKYFFSSKFLFIKMLL